MIQLIAIFSQLLAVKLEYEIAKNKIIHYIVIQYNY